MVQYLDAGFAAMADATRRGILERLGKSPASITDLAEQFDMTLTGIKKHVAVLEDAGFIRSKKIGRVRTCALGPRTLDRETRWIEQYTRMLEQRLNSLEEFLERTKGENDT
ncbi:MAG TPA: metalloregulator ArsR/SmtB family transcription factor [Gemmatimonadaceae bacterium]|nr:metalloregulator ArsR/SmtB family transcription factor [Gemmatimonadaceae bacterium]